MLTTEVVRPGLDAYKNLMSREGSHKQTNTFTAIIAHNDIFYLSQEI
jgi:hypothetical protein